MNFNTTAVFSLGVLHLFLQGQEDYVSLDPIDKLLAIRSFLVFRKIHPFDLNCLVFIEFFYL